MVGKKTDVLYRYDLVGKKYQPGKRTSGQRNTFDTGKETMSETGVVLEKILRDGVRKMRLAALDAIKEQTTFQEIAQKHGVHQTVITQWKPRRLRGWESCSRGRKLRVTLSDRRKPSGIDC